MELPTPAHLQQVEGCEAVPMGDQGSRLCLAISSEGRTAITPPADEGCSSLAEGCSSLAFRAFCGDFGWRRCTSGAA